jgi:hypothetical protein
MLNSSSCNEAVWLKTKNKSQLILPSHFLLSLTFLNNNHQLNLIQIIFFGKMFSFYKSINILTPSGGASTSLWEGRWFQMICFYV